jgi:hypothetical protein
MEFKGPYLFAMRERAPKMFMELCRSGQLDKYVKERGLEAHALLDQLLASEPKGVDGLPKDTQAQRLAEEQVMAQMLDFPAPEDRHDREPPEDLKTAKPSAEGPRLRRVK